MPRACVSAVIPTPTIPADAALLTKKQVAQMTQVTCRTLEKWVSRGIVPGQTNLPGSNRVRFQRNAVEAWIANGIFVGE